MGNSDSKFELQTILQKQFHLISVNKRRAREKSKLMKCVVEEIVLPELLKNVQFKELFSHIFYTGSFSDGLRVMNAKEFDVNIVLKMPQESNYSHSSPGHAKICIKEDEVFEAGLFSTETLKRWFEELMDDILKNVLTSRFFLESKIYTIMTTKSGPAITLRIYGEGENFRRETFLFGIDLVPVFEAFTDNCFLVPKHPISRNEFEWRLSYPHKERRILKGKKIAKTVIRLLKYACICRSWDLLCSYHIKTLIMHCVDLSSDENDLISFLYESVKLLLKYLDNRNIPFYHDPRYNLLQKANEIEISKLRSNLFDMLLQVKEKPSKVHNFIYDIVYAQKEHIFELRNLSRSIESFERAKNDSGFRIPRYMWDEKNFELFTVDNPSLSSERQKLYDQHLMSEYFSYLMHDLLKPWFVPAAFLQQIGDMMGEFMIIHGIKNIVIVAHRFTELMSQCMRFNSTIRIPLLAQRFNLLIHDFIIIDGTKNVCLVARHLTEILVRLILSCMLCPYDEFPRTLLRNQEINEIMACLIVLVRTGENLTQAQRFDELIDEFIVPNKTKDMITLSKYCGDVMAKFIRLMLEESVTVPFEIMTQFILFCAIRNFDNLMLNDYYSVLGIDSDEELDKLSYCPIVSKQME